MERDSAMPETSLHHSKQKKPDASWHEWFQGLQIGTIRTRLLVAFVLLVLLPSTIISFSAVILGLQQGRQQVITQLKSVATLKQEQINTWLDNLHIHMAAVISPYKVDTLLEPILNNEPDSADYQQAYHKLFLQFQDMVETTQLFEEVMVLDKQGRVVLSTNPDSVGQVSAGQTYFWHGLKEPYTQSLSASTAQGLSSPVIVSRPVVNTAGDVRGVIAGWASGERLNDIMLQRAGLGKTGETYLVGSNFLLLTESRFEGQGEKILRLQTETIESVFRNRKSSSGLFENYRHQSVVGVYHWLPDLQMVLVAEQGQREAFQATYTTLFVNGLIAVAAILLAFLSALIISQGIAAPLASLADTATRIADGDLNLIANVRQQDEVGALAHAFNRMTSRLRQLIIKQERHIGELQYAEAEVRRVNADLERTVTELEQYNLDMQLLNRLSSTIQRCENGDEAYATSVPLLGILFAERAGVFYRHSNTPPYLQLVGTWGDKSQVETLPQPSECHILTNAQPTNTRAKYLSGKCWIGTANNQQKILCIPLHAGDKLLGVLHVQLHENESDAIQERLARLGNRTADLLALALANLQLREDLEEQAVRDPLTGLFNRRFLNEVLKQELDHARRHQQTLALLLLDIDHFKHMNDTYGHDAGDAVLRVVGQLLSTSFRPEDTVCRFGGEEMLVVLPGISRDSACARAERLRQAMNDLHIEYEGVQLPSITASIGVAVFPMHGQNPDSLIIAADQALYRAKHNGRNRVLLADTPVMRDA
jgi:diguanylate cyclase (GGDEF)-like protein